MANLDTFGKRLLHIRTIVKKSKKEMEELFGFGTSRYWAYEADKAPDIQKYLKILQKLRKESGFSYQWLIDGPGFQLNDES